MLSLKRKRDAHWRVVKDYVTIDTIYALLYYDGASKSLSYSSIHYLILDAFAFTDHFRPSSDESTILRRIINNLFNKMNPFNDLATTLPDWYTEPSLDTIWSIIKVAATTGASGWTRSRFPWRLKKLPTLSSLSSRSTI